MHIMVYYQMNSKISLQFNLSKPIGSWIIDQKNILTVSIHNFKITWPSKISMLFLSALDNLL